jgi:hypothetical protein
MMSPFNPDLPRRINGIQRKCVIINDRLVVGFTGRVDAAKFIFPALERKFSRHNRGPSLAELEATLRPLRMQLYSQKIEGTVIGWTIRNRPICFYWKTGLGERLTLTGMRIDGSGKQRFYESLSGHTSMGYSDGVQNAYEKSCLLGICKIGNVLLDEIMSGDNLSLGYGYGAELVLFNGTRFEFIPKIGYMFWNVRQQLDGSMTLLPANIMAVYENKGRYALLNVIQSHFPEKGSMIVDNSYVAVLTPLHDDMAGQISCQPDDAPDILCPYYYWCFSVVDAPTQVRSLIRGAVKMDEGFTLFGVRKGDDNKYYISVNWQELSELIKDATVLAPTVPS